MNIIRHILILIVFLSSWNVAFPQGATCNTSDPFCTGTTATFPASTGTGTAAVGNNYGCLGTQPNPAWYYLEIDQPGNLTIDMNNTANVDIDFALWGPFPNFTAAMGNCGSLAAPIDCGYTTSPTETANITGAVTGDVYIILITNFSNSATDISFTNTGGNATTNCSIVNPCIINSLSTNPGACNPANNLYDVSGNITFTDPPRIRNLNTNRLPW